MPTAGGGAHGTGMARLRELRAASSADLRRCQSISWLVPESARPKMAMAAAGTYGNISWHNVSWRCDARGSVLGGGGHADRSCQEGWELQPRQMPSVLGGGDHADPSCQGAAGAAKLLEAGQEATARITVLFLFVRGFDRI
jgi:hypothetical protein